MKQMQVKPSILASGLTSPTNGTSQVNNFTITDLSSDILIYLLANFFSPYALRRLHVLSRRIDELAKRATILKNKDQFLATVNESRKRCNSQLISDDTLHECEQQLTASEINFFLGRRTFSLFPCSFEDAAKKLRAVVEVNFYINPYLTDIYLLNLCSKNLSPLSSTMIFNKVYAEFHRLISDNLQTYYDPARVFLLLYLLQSNFHLFPELDFINKQAVQIMENYLSATDLAILNTTGILENNRLLFMPPDILISLYTNTGRTLKNIILLKKLYPEMFVMSGDYKRMLFRLCAIEDELEIENIESLLYKFWIQYPSLVKQTNYFSILRPLLEIITGIFPVNNHLKQIFTTAHRFIGKFNATCQLFERTDNYNFFRSTLPKNWIFVEEKFLPGTSLSSKYRTKAILSIDNPLSAPSIASAQVTALAPQTFSVESRIVNDETSAKKTENKEVSDVVMIETDEAAEQIPSKVEEGMWSPRLYQQNTLAKTPGSDGESISKPFNL